MDESSAEVSRVWEALRGVLEPELRKDIVALEMVKDVIARDQTVSLTFTLTTPACPLKEEIETRIREELLQLEGVRAVEIKMEASVPKARDLQGRAPILGVKNIVAVASGKGGVGKTTVAVNIAIALARLGAAVGLMDSDVYGPNVPRMMGIQGSPQAVGDRLRPLEGLGLRVMSMGFLNPGDRPMIWRGPMLHSVIQQFLRNVDWGELDYLILDLPPGTGDVQLTLTQTGATLGRGHRNDAFRRGPGRRPQSRRDVPAGEGGSSGHHREHELLSLPALWDAGGNLQSRGRQENERRIQRALLGRDCA